jgi:hypothetical protein
VSDEIGTLTEARTVRRHCQDHASARFRPAVCTDRPGPRCSRTSGAVDYDLNATPASDGSVARYYDPVTGQFLSVDPAVSVTEQPYSYVGDDPLNATDPAGEFCFSTSCLLGDVAAGLSAVSAVTSVLSVIGFPEAEAISFATALGALAADSANCIIYQRCDWTSIALDIVALIPGAAALKAEHDVRGIEDIIKGGVKLAELIDPELKYSKEFLGFAHDVEDVIAANFSATAAVIGAGVTNTSSSPEAQRHSSPPRPKCP